MRVRTKGQPAKKPDAHTGKSNMQGDSRHVLFDFMDYLYEKIGAKVPLFCNICKFLRDFFLFFFHSKGENLNYLVLLYSLFRDLSRLCLPLPVPTCREQVGGKKEKTIAPKGRHNAPVRGEKTLCRDREARIIGGEREKIA